MKDIDGFEGRYAVTKDGRVWSYPKSWETGQWEKKMTMRRNGHFLKQRRSKQGYLVVHLRSNYKNKVVVVHRLVAKAFIENPHCLREVNHRNGIKIDNRVENLEWCTRSENMQHASRNGLLRRDSP
jgi:hypothetical protein